MKINHPTFSARPATLVRALALAGVVVAASAGAVSAPSANTAFASLPMAFESSGPARFVARGNSCFLAIGPTTAELGLSKLTVEPADAVGPRGATSRVTRSISRSVTLHFLGANSEARVAGEGELPSRVNYFLGNDPAQWRVNQPLTSRVRVSGIYEGVDLIYYGNAQRLEYDFVLAPEADAKRIAFRVTGADSIQLNSRGDLVLKLGADEIAQPRPVIYQEIAGARKNVSGGYALRGRDTVAFEIGEYDHTRPLVIDPFLSYARYFGASGEDDARCVRVSRDGYVYIAGRTLSAVLPATSGAVQTNYGGGTRTGGDAFVAKFDLQSTNATPLFVTYLGGSTDDEAWGLALDDDGNAYVTGFTDSTNFPIASAATAYRPTISGGTYGVTGRYFTDAFVVKLAASGSNLLFSTYLGGTNVDVGYGIALDAARNVFVAGYTVSSNLPVTPGAFRTVPAGGGDAFVAELDASGTNLVYLTYLGGTNQDAAYDVAVDNAGAAYLTGFTASRDFYTTSNALQTLLNSSTNNLLADDAFLVKLSAGGSNATFSTLMGGATSDLGSRLAVNRETGEAYVIGTTFSLGFPNNRSNYFANTLSNSAASDVFVMRFNPDGSTNYSAVFGGHGTEQGWDIALDSAGNVHITGTTSSTNFPTAPTNNTLGISRGTNATGFDVFVAEINSNATAFVYSAVLGGTGSDVARAIAIDPLGNDYLAGETSSTNFPTLAPFASSFGGTNDAFLVKISVDTPPALTIQSAGSDVAVSWPGFTPEYVLQTSSNLADANGWTFFAPAPAASNLTHTVLLAPTNDAAFFRLGRP